jgi:hypothetical protein
MITAGRTTVISPVGRGREKRDFSPGPTGLGLGCRGSLLVAVHESRAAKP